MDVVPLHPPRHPICPRLPPQLLASPLQEQEDSRDERPLLCTYSTQIQIRLMLFMLVTVWLHKHMGS